MLARQADAGEGRQLFVRERAIADLVGLRGLGGDVFGIAAIEGAGEGTGEAERARIGLVGDKVEDHALAHPAPVDTFAHGGDTPHHVDALDEGKITRLAAQARHRIGVAIGSVGADTVPDIRVVEARGRHLYQDLVRLGLGHRHVRVVEHVEPAMAPRHHRLHGCRNHPHPPSFLVPGAVSHLRPALQASGICP